MYQMKGDKFMKLLDLDIAINDLMEKLEDGETTTQENEFLINVTNDLIEALHAEGFKLDIDKRVKHDSFEDSVANGWIYG